MPKTRPAPAFGRTFAALGERNFRLYYFGQMASQTGTWMRSAALGWLALQRTGSEFWLGMVTVATGAPLLLLSPWAGSLADRRSRLGIFRATTALALLASAALGLLLLMEGLPTPLLFGLAVIWGIATAIEMPARQSMVVDLAGREHLVNAIALNSASINATRVVGPALGGLLLAAVGAAWCFLTDAASYAVVLGTTFLLRMPPAKPARPAAQGSHLAEGARYVLGHAVVRPAMLMLAVMSVFAWPYLSQMAAVAKLAFGLEAKGYGLLLAANGVGAVAAALRTAAVGGRADLTARMRHGAWIFTLGLAAASCMPGPWSAGAAFAVAGYGLVTFFSSCNSHVQSHTDDRFRGRVMGLYALVFGGGMPVGALWLGAASERLGVMPALRVAALLTLAASEAARLAGRRRA